MPISKKPLLLDFTPSPDQYRVNRNGTGHNGNGHNGNGHKAQQRKPVPLIDLSPQLVLCLRCEAVEQEIPENDESDL